MEDRALIAAYNAVEYHKWHVFPLCANTKRPLLPWRETSSDSAAQVKKWSAQHPECNWAVDCGKSGLVVLDVDTKNGANGKRSVMELELDAMKLIHTYTVCTPNDGLHYYYTGRAASRNGIRPGVDVKAAGGYVVLPGSTLPTGNYWISEDVPVARCPAWLSTFVREAALPKHPLREQWLTAPDQPQAVEWSINWLLNDAPECVQGQRGDDLLVKKIFFTLRDNGISVERAAALVAEYYNDMKSFPPWTGAELRLKAANAYRYAALPPANATDAVKTALATEAFREETKLCNAASIRIDDVPRRQWVLGRRLLRRYLTGTVAPGGVGKSTFAFLEALAVATGKPLTGDVVHATGPVILFNAEDRLDELKMRLAAVAQLYDVHLWELDGIKYQPIYLLSGRDYKLRIAAVNDSELVVNDTCIKSFKAMIRDTRAILFCGDPFVRLHEMPENDNMAIDKVVEAFTDLAETLNVAVHLVHHTRKRGPTGGEGNAETARGASAFADALRVVHTITTMSEEEAKLHGIPKDLKDWYVRLDDAKLNFAPPASVVRWFKRVSVDLPNGEAVGTLQTVNLALALTALAPPGEESLEDVARVLAFCQVGDTPVLETIRQICAEFPDEKRTASALSMSVRRQLKTPVRLGNQEISLVDRGHGEVNARWHFRVKQIDTTLGKAIEELG